MDFSELNLEDPDDGEDRYLKGLDKVAGKIVETGCTSFVPTIITQKEELYQKVSPLSAYVASQETARELHMYLFASNGD